MQILDWLREPELRAMLLPGLVGGIAVVITCALLSVLVVLKRLAFVGQGVSHSAFGGIGLAAYCGFLAHAAADSAGTSPAYSWLITSGIVLVFCIVSAIGMGLLADMHGVREDTAIGVFLVAAMALGGLLLSLAIQRGRLSGNAGYESILFGQVLAVSWSDAGVAVVACAAVVVTVWVLRRPMLFWAFDETSATAFGAPSLLLRLTLMVLLCIAIVTAMKIVGVVLATALLVLPGASALRLSDRLARVVVLSVGFGVLGLAGGVVIATEQGSVPPGATIVLSLCALFAAAWIGGIMQRKFARPDRTRPGRANNQA
ncbi:MAG: metal ABC transporter permease [Phycisphaerales bacterium]